MPTYSVHALVVDSELRLPELRRVEAEPDVRLRVGEVPETPDQQVEDGKMYRAGDGHYLRFTGAGAVYGTDGDRLVVELEDGTDPDPDLFRWFALSHGFRILLYQRGYVVLHASATVVDGRAVAFLGKSGQGKSTTVAAWHAAGYPVLSDDVVAVDPDTGLVTPSFPKIKLDPESVPEVDADLTPAERNDAISRQYYATSREYRDDPVPLGNVYLLADGPELRIEELPPAKQAYLLMRESASAYHAGDDEAVESHFDDCVRLSSTVPVKRLERPRTFDALPELVSAVEADLGEASPTEQATKR